MLGQPFHLFDQPIGIESFDGLHNSSMESTSPPLQETSIGHLMGQSMLEGVFLLGKEPCLVEELGRLEVRETAMQRRLGQLGDGLQQRQGDLRPDDGSGLEEPFLLRWEPIDARGQHRLHRGWDL
jgi:hypothetical protein